MEKKILLALLMSCFALFTSASNYLTFTAEIDKSSFYIASWGDNHPNVEYSLDDGETWTLLETGLHSPDVTFLFSEDVTLINKGDKVLLRGNNPNGFSSDSENYSLFMMNGKIAASGSVMSLIDGIGESKTIPSSYCFGYLFYSNSSLTQAPELPATELTEKCYEHMFDYCENLTMAPVLPATKLANSCYSGMFLNCLKLTQAPELPATELAEKCYESMFYGTGLLQAPELPATKLANHCYYNMFSSCTSLTKAPKLPATELADSCYFGMFSICESLTQAPELPATILAPSCYEYMFNRTGLLQAPELPATELAENCYKSMFARTKLAKAPELPATKLANHCYDRMFEACDNLTMAPELPAMELANGCYEGMFSFCENLTQATKLPATKLTDDCYNNMFAYCINLTQAPELPATELTYRCYAYIFNECEKLQEIKVGFTEWEGNMITWVWADDVAPTGTFYCPKELPLEYGQDRIPEGWNVVYIDKSSDVAEYVSDASFKAWGADGKITYSGATMPVRIYDISGRVVKEVKGKTQSVSVPQHGTYVVTSGTVSLKVEL